MTLPLSKDRKFYLDLGERAGWAALWAILSVVQVDQLGLPAWSVLPTMAALSGLKSLVARHVGRDDSASVVPVV